MPPPTTPGDPFSHAVTSAIPSSSVSPHRTSSTAARRTHDSTHSHRDHVDAQDGVVNAYHNSTHSQPHSHDDALVVDANSAQASPPCPAKREDAMRPRRHRSSRSRSHSRVREENGIRSSNNINGIITRSNSMGSSNKSTPPSHRQRLWTKPRTTHASTPPRKRRSLHDKQANETHSMQQPTSKSECHESCPPSPIVHVNHSQEEKDLTRSIPIHDVDNKHHLPYEQDQEHAYMANPTKMESHAKGEGRCTREPRQTRHGKEDVLSITTLQRNLDSLDKEVAHVMGHVDHAGKRRGNGVLEKERMCCPAEKAVVETIASCTTGTQSHPVYITNSIDANKNIDHNSSNNDHTHSKTNSKNKHEMSKASQSTATTEYVVCRLPVCDATSGITNTSPRRHTAANKAASSSSLLPAGSSSSAAAATANRPRHYKEEEGVSLPTLPSVPVILPITLPPPMASSAGLTIPPLLSSSASFHKDRHSSHGNIRNSINPIPAGDATTQPGTHTLSPTRASMDSNKSGEDSVMLNGANTMQVPITHRDKRTLPPSTSLLNGVSQTSSPSNNSNSNINDTNTAIMTLADDNSNTTNTTATITTTNNVRNSNGRGGKTRRGRIAVVVRKRPMHPGERGSDCVRVCGSELTLSVTRARVDLTNYTESTTLTFDHVFDAHASNACVHVRCTRELLDVALRGGHASCFAFGQTGSGKTYTMLGGVVAEVISDGKEKVCGTHTEAVTQPTGVAHVRSCASSSASASSMCVPPSKSDAENTRTMHASTTPGQSDDGLYQLAAHELMTRLQPGQRLCVSFFEIYCNSVFDLLQQRAPVVLREDGKRRVHLRGLSWHTLAHADDVRRLTRQGLEQRRTGSTGAHEHSSRSHAVFTLRIISDVATPSEELNSTSSSSSCSGGMVHYVDLAGSERAADTAGQDRRTRQEGAEINKSLLALKECIRALDEKQRHIPFRGSRLTEVLRDSFTGAMSRTVMIANVSPSSADYEHTANTLRYAFRVQGLSVPRVSPSRERNAPRMFVPIHVAPSASAVHNTITTTNSNANANSNNGNDVEGSASAAGPLPLLPVRAEEESSEATEDAANRRCSSAQRRLHIDGKPHHRNATCTHHQHDGPSHSLHTRHGEKQYPASTSDVHEGHAHRKDKDNTNNIPTRTRPAELTESAVCIPSHTAPHHQPHHPAPMHRAESMHTGTIHSHRRHRCRRRNSSSGALTHHGSHSTSDRHRRASLLGNDDSDEDDAVCRAKVKTSANEHTRRHPSHAKPTTHTTNNTHTNNNNAGEDSRTSSHHSRHSYPPHYEHTHKPACSKPCLPLHSASGSRSTSPLHAGSERTNRGDTLHNNTNNRNSNTNTEAVAHSPREDVTRPVSSCAAQTASQRQVKQTSERSARSASHAPVHNDIKRDRGGLSTTQTTPTPLPTTSPTASHVSMTAETPPSSCYRPLPSFTPTRRRRSATRTAAAGTNTALALASPLSCSSPREKEGSSSSSSLSASRVDHAECRRERALRRRVMRQLRRDLTRDIHAILDDRDARIATLKEENVHLRSRLAALEQRIHEQDGGAP